MNRKTKNSKDMVVFGRIREPLKQRKLKLFFKFAKMTQQDTIETLLDVAMGDCEDPMTRGRKEQLALAQRKLRESFLNPELPLAGFSE